MPFQTHFQVPNLLSLGFHLVCEDTHLSQEIKQGCRIGTGSPLEGSREATPLILDVRRMAVIFGGWQVGEVSCMKGTPVAFSPGQEVPATTWTRLVTFPALDRLRRKPPSSHESGLGPGLWLLMPLTELPWAARPQGIPQLARQGFCHLTWKRNPNFSAEQPMTLPVSSGCEDSSTYQARALKQLRNVGRKGHVLAPTKLGCRKVFVLHRPKHDFKS